MVYMEKVSTFGSGSSFLSIKTSKGKKEEYNPQAEVVKHSLVDFSGQSQMEEED